MHPFQMRDGDAAMYILTALAKRGYRYHGTIFNYPSPETDFIPFTEVAFLPSDLILLTTRPPMDDDKVGDKKGFSRSFTTLEELLFQGALRPRFARCSRSEIVLTDATVAISPAIGQRKSSIFRQNCGATYKSAIVPPLRFAAAAEERLASRQRTPGTR